MIASHCQTAAGQSQQWIRRSARSVAPRHLANRSRRAFSCSSRVPSQELRSINGRRLAAKSNTRNVRVDATPFIQSGSVAGKGGIVYLAGATGQVSIRLLRELASAGFKVVAGVPDQQEASVILDFSTRFEIIARNVTENILVKEAAVSDVEAMASSIPKGARVVVVDNDGAGKAKTDSKGVSSVVAAAVQAGASQIILLTPLQGETGTSFFFFGGPSASSKPSERLSRVEQLVADSGVPFTIVRVAGLTSVKEAADTKSLLVGPAGTYAPAAPPAPRNLLGEVLACVLTSSSAGSVLEVVPNTEAQEAEPVTQQVGKAVSAYRSVTEQAVKESELRQSVAQASKTVSSRTQSSKTVAEEKEEKEEPTKPALPALPANLFGFASAFKSAAAAAAPVAAAPAPEPEAPPKKAGPQKAAPKPLFSFGAAKKAAPVEEEPEEKEEEKPAPKPAPLFSFGARKAPVKKEEVVVIVEEPPAPKPKPAPLFSFGARKAPAKTEEVKEEEAPAPAAKPAPFFAFGGSFGARKAAVKEEEEVEQEPAPKKSASFFSFGGSFGAPKKAAPEPEATASPRGRVAAKAVPVKSARPGTQTSAQKPGTQKTVPTRPGTQTVRPGTQRTTTTKPGTQVQQRGTQKAAVQKVAPPPKKALPPPPKKALPPPVAKKAVPPPPAKKAAAGSVKKVVAPPPKKGVPPAKGRKTQSGDDEEEPPKKGFRLFPL